MNNAIWIIEDLTRLLMMIIAPAGFLAPEGQKPEEAP